MFADFEILSFVAFPRLLCPQTRQQIASRIAEAATNLTPVASLTDLVQRRYRLPARCISLMCDAFSPHTRCALALPLCTCLRHIAGTKAASLHGETTPNAQKWLCVPPRRC